MPRKHEFRFAVSAQPVDTGDKWRELARAVEDLGYSTLFLPDHLGEQLAPMPALAVAAEVTSRLRIGMLVAANDFRHPVLHAKEVATLDLLSDGRVEWGVGAGWFVPEFKASGIPFDPPRVRVSRLEESVSVMRALFDGGEVDYEGGHYRIAHLEGSPKPVQRPHPPLLVGGALPRMLSFAGREANIAGIAPSPTTKALGGPPRHTITEALDQQISWIRSAAGDRFDDLELNAVAMPATITSDRHERDVRAEKIATRREVRPDQLLSSPHVMLGTVEQVCDDLEADRERWGISYRVIPAHSAAAFAPVVDRLSGR